MKPKSKPGLELKQIGAMRFTLKLPPPLNQMYHPYKGRMVLSYIAKNWARDLSYFFMQQRPYAPWDNIIHVEMVIYLKFDRDIDSSTKLLFDTLEDCRIIKNDKYITKMTVEKRRDKDNPRLELSLYHLAKTEI